MNFSQKPYSQRRYSNAAINQHADVSAVPIGTSSPAQLFLVTVRSSNPAMGSVRIEAVYVPKTEVIDRSALSDKRYPSGTVLRLVAESEAGCQFAGWNDGIPNPTREITVKGNAEYVASFMSAGGEEPGGGNDDSGNGTGGGIGGGVESSGTGNTITRQSGVVAFIRKWWWAILILACMIHDVKGGQ